MASGKARIAMGQWSGVVRITGAGLALRVWTLLALPLEYLPIALTVKGAGGSR